MGYYDSCTCGILKIGPDSSGKFRDSSGEGVILNNPSPAIVSKQTPSRLNHFFTFYYKDVNQIAPIVAELKTKAFKGKVQTEICPSTKRPHLQGMVWCKLKCRDTCFKLLKSANFRKLKDVDDTANYCNKDESHDGVYRTNWGFPEPAYVEEIDELYKWEIDIIELLKTEPDKRTIHWFWEPNGCAGKTTFQKYLYTRMERIVVLSGKAADMKMRIVQFKEQNNGALPRIVLINIPCSCLDFVSYTGIEEIKDMFFFSGKYEGGDVHGKCPHVICFANEEPCYAKMTSNRFVVKNIAQD